MIFVTDDHRTIKLAQKNREARGVVPELDESLKKSLTAETTEHLKPRVAVTIERRMADVNRKF